MTYEVVIGLEVHAQLKTESKMFCGCTTRFGGAPNHQTCPACLGLPGSLPVVNKKAIALAMRAAQALGCSVQPKSSWSRKNYFYPDLPKGYQITQFDEPIALGGELHIDVDGIVKRAQLTRIHMEEDAGKNIHDDLTAGRRSYVDFNRGGTPLIEIVGEPDLRSSAEAAAYLKTLRQILRYLDVCDGNMDEGSFRCDANVSLRKAGTQAFGTRCELKNLNSFRYVQQAIDYEILRQTEVLEAGGVITQETRLWDVQAKMTRALRSKEEAHDYRYFPEPDLPHVVLDEASLRASQKALCELPQQKRERYQKEMGLTAYDARVLTDDRAVAAFFEDALGTQKNYKSTANWVMGEVLRELKDRPITSLPFAGEVLGELVMLIDQDVISGKIAKEVFAEMMKTGAKPKAIVADKNLGQVSDPSALEKIVGEVVAQEAESVAKFHAGKTNVLGFLVGQVMQKTRGRAHPKRVNDLLLEKLRQVSEG